MQKIVYMLTVFFMFSTSIFAKSELFSLENKDLFDLSLSELLNIEIDSADKTSIPIKDIPASTTIITRSEIEKYGYASLPEVLRNIPGLYIQDNTESLFLGVRGNVGGGLQFLINGIIAHPSLTKGLTSTDINQFNIPISAIDRIEIIRGPMSVVYGNNAFLGIVNIITNDVQREDGLVNLSYGTQNSVEVFARYGMYDEDGFFVINLGANKTDGLEGEYKDMLGTDQLLALHPDTVSSIDRQMESSQISLDLSSEYKDFRADLSYRKKTTVFIQLLLGLIRVLMSG